MGKEGGRLPLKFLVVTTGGAIKETEDFGKKRVRELDQEFSFRYAHFKVLVCPRGMSSRQLSILFLSSGERHARDTHICESLA